MVKTNLESKFDEKVKELEVELPRRKANVNCAELTLTSVLEVLGVDNYMFHNTPCLTNIIVPISIYPPDVASACIAILPGYFTLTATLSPMS